MTKDWRKILTNFLKGFSQHQFSFHFKFGSILSHFGTFGHNFLAYFSHYLLTLFGLVFLGIVFCMRSRNLVRTDEKLTKRFCVDTPFQNPRSLGQGDHLKEEEAYNVLENGCVIFGIIPSDQITKISLLCQYKTLTLKVLIPNWLFGNDCFRSKSIRPKTAIKTASCLRSSLPLSS